MGLYKYLSQAWKKPVYKDKTRTWTKESVITRVNNPTRLDKARSLGFKRKQGFVIVRTRILKGGRQRPTIRKGRKPKHYGHRKFTPSQNKQSIAEKRVSRKYPNMEVMNSYYVGENGQYKFYEVILVDTNHPIIAKDKKFKWLKNNRRRVFRGKTSAARKARGLR